MKNTFKKVLCLVLVLCMLLSVAVVLASCKRYEGEGEYTYNSWSTALGTNWNPHTWETSADDSILSYISSPFVTIEAKDTEEGLYQWVYEMATSIEDVTADHQDDLTKYDVNLPKGKDAEDVTEGYVFEIKLNPNAKWENGEKITADDYIYSMKQLLNSKMRNYRANLYYSGESALAGAYEYFNSEAPLYDPTVEYVFDETLGEEGDYVRTVVVPADKAVYLSLKAENMTMASYSFTFMLDYYVEQALYDKLAAMANPYGMIELTDDNYADIVTICDQYLMAFGESVYVMDFIADSKGDYVWDADEEDYVAVEEGTGTHKYDYVLEDGKKVVNEEYFEEFFFWHNGYGEAVEYDDTVGCYKVDEYTIRYVCDTAIDFNYFLTSCTSTWLVYEELYEAGKSQKDGLTITNYGTSKATSMSYGTYKIEAFQDAKQVIFVQNENWYGFTKLEDGSLYSETQFEVDGKKHQQYQTTKVVIDVMTEDAAKQKFFKGELMEYSPNSDELSSYVTSDRLYKVDETYTMSFFFNTGIDALKALDKAGNNKNSVVLSNYNFRKAMSLAINRSDFVTVTQAWTPAYAIMNGLYHYDIYNDPTSSYRKSDAAMQAIVNLYGVEYGEGKTYATLEEAYKSITGYNLNQAKTLMATACDELVEAGLYTKGQDIKIQIGWAKGALTADDNAQLAKINQYVNAALAGSGFGSITFEAIGNIDDRYGDVPAGKYAIGYGAWGGAAFYPFRNFQVYMDPDNTAIHEAGCWDPTIETLTLSVTDDEGKTENVTMTWQQWSNSMIGTGKYAGASNDVKLQITAMLEEAYLKLYYRIPLAGTTVCYLLSYKVDEYADTYNIMYGFGGFRLMSYNYDDAEWAEYVDDQGGTLNYN